MTSKSHDHTAHLRIFMAAFAITAIAIIGCADFGTGIIPPVNNGDNGDGDSVSVSFAAQVLPIFQTECDGGFCHLPCGPNNGRGLCLVSHATLVSAGVVIAGDAQNSILVMRLEGRVTPRMPYGSINPLPDTLIQLIRTWIDEGALDN